MPSEPGELRRAINAFVDDQRARCLWDLPVDFYPSTVSEQLGILERIARTGDLQAFQTAGRLRQWLLRTSSETSAVS